MSKLAGNIRLGGARGRARERLGFVPDVGLNHVLGFVLRNALEYVRCDRVNSD